MDKNRHMLSVCVLAYNHEKYVLQAIESILSQNTDFDFEIVIGEDNSSDNTRKICEELFQLYPKQIRLLHTEKNLGMQANFLRIVNECNGKYIAICEADDYWTDVNKLQIQVDFLEKNKDFVLSFHNVDVLYEVTGERKAFNSFQSERVFDINDILKNWIIGTQSMVFRNVLPELVFPDSFRCYYTPDRFLQILLASKGLVKYFPNVMAVYRINESSITIRENYGKSVGFYQNVIGMYADLKNILDSRYNSILNKMLKKMIEECEMAKAIEMSNEKNKYKTFQFLLNSFKMNPFRIIKQPRLYLGIIKNSF